MGKNYNRTLNVLLITIEYRGNNDGVQFGSKNCQPSTGQNNHCT